MFLSGAVARWNLNESVSKIYFIRLCTIFKSPFDLYFRPLKRGPNNNECVRGPPFISSRSDPCWSISLFLSTSLRRKYFIQFNIEHNRTKRFSYMYLTRNKRIIHVQFGAISGIFIFTVLFLTKYRVSTRINK